MSDSDHERKKKEKEELEAVKKAATRAWKIHQAKQSKAKSNGKPKK